MIAMLSRAVLIVTVCLTAATAQKYSGPRPEKPDLPYLLHADNLVATEAGQAGEESKKDEITYFVNGPASAVKTPLASPIFLLLAQNLNPEKLQLYRLEVKNGRREITFKKKKSNVKPVFLTVTRVAENL